MHMNAYRQNIIVITGKDPIIPRCPECTVKPGFLRALGLESVHGHCSHLFPSLLAALLLLHHACSGSVISLRDGFSCGWVLCGFCRFPADLLFTSSSGELWRMVRIGGQPLGFGESQTTPPTNSFRSSKCSSLLDQALTEQQSCNTSTQLNLLLSLFLSLWQFFFYS